jgi:nitrogen fixation/metabolism regulation signal transduction histidine kinase
MTFRKITFIFTAMLLSALLLIQLWLFQNFTKDVSSKIGEAAFEVSVSTIQTMLSRPVNLEFRNFAIRGDINERTQLEILKSLRGNSSNIHVDLLDGQRDKSISIQSAGANYNVNIPRTGIETSLEKMSSKILVSALISILVGLLIASYFSTRLAIPLRQLQKVSKKVGKGEFGLQIEVPHKLQSIELRETIDAFNEMSRQIERLKIENEQLQKKAHLSELTEITRGLAHTIRNPLNTLNLAIDEIQSNVDNKQKDELCKVSKHQVSRIDKWVRSLMDIMSSDASLVEQVNIPRLVETCVDDLKLNPLNRIHIGLKVDDIFDDQNNQILAINSELKSLFLTLLNNAIESVTEKHLDDKTGFVKVEVSFKETIEIAIKDNGAGLSKTINEKLFSPHNTNKTYGAGMGLYLAHRVATLKYNGNLIVTNNSELIVDNSDKGSQTNTGCTAVLTLNNRV